MKTAPARLGRVGTMTGSASMKGHPMSHNLSTRYRPVPQYTLRQNGVYCLDLGRRAREAARIAELLGPAGLVFLRDLLAVSS